MALLDVVIVNWNAGQQLRDCVDSLIRFGSSLIFQIIVVDNGSTDGSENAVAGLPGVVLIRAGENLGFGKACNLGAMHASSEYVLFLNPDATIFAETLPAALGFMQQARNAAVGVCGVQLVDQAGHIARSCARFPSVTGMLAHAVGADVTVPRLGQRMAEWDHLESRSVDQVIGAFFMVRRTLFEILQGFDERFFVYYEEVDFARRAKALGWSSFYVAEAQAFHAGGGTSQQVKARRLFYSLRSRILYAFKHFNSFEAILVLLATLFIEVLSRSALAVARRSWVSLQETLTAYGMLYRWVPQWLRRDITR